MGCLRPFGTPNHIRQCAHSHPDLFIDLFVQCTASVCFFPPLQHKQPSDTVPYSSSPLPSKPQTAVSNTHPVRCSSFNLMEPVAPPAVSRNRPACPITHARSHCPRACHISQTRLLSIWAVALPQRDPSLGGEVKPPACRGHREELPFAHHHPPSQTQPQISAASVQTHLTMAFKLGYYQV